MLIWPIFLVEIQVISSFVCFAQSRCVLCAQAGIAPGLSSGHGPVSKLDCIKLVVLLSQQIDELHVSHPQETKWPSRPHQLRQELGLV